MESRAFCVAFASSFDLDTREYLLFDFARITAAVGGAMGLFLGVSLFQVFCRSSIPGQRYECIANNFQGILFITEKLSGSGYKVQVNELGGSAKSEIVNVKPASRSHIISVPE